MAHHNNSGVSENLDTIGTRDLEESKKDIHADEADPENTTTPPVSMTSLPVSMTSPSLVMTSPPISMTSPSLGETSPSVTITSHSLGKTSPSVTLTSADDVTDGAIKYPMPLTDGPVYQEGQLDEEDVDFIAGSLEETSKYKMDHRRRGIFVILNNKIFHDSSIPDRHGTDVDASNLFHTFTNLGFTVYLYSNKKRQEMISILHTASKQNHQDADCFGCAILSHGSDGVVYGIDEVVRVDEIVEAFRGHRCPQLLGKPKLFFIQACRGVKIDHGVDFTDGDEFDSEMENNSPQLQRIPTEADFLFAYSTAPGYFSWRHSVKGSWFVQALCRVLKRHALEKEIMWILTEVNKTVAYEFESSACQPFMRRKKQVPSIVSMLTGELYFPKKENTLETLV